MVLLVERPSAEDSLRLKMAAALGATNFHEKASDDVGTPFGYVWWRVRNDDGLLVYGGVGRSREVIVDPSSPGNVRYVNEGGTIVGGGYAPQQERFDIAATVAPRTAPLAPVHCQECMNVHRPDEDCY